jgi:hypothetical protein
MVSVVLVALLAFPLYWCLTTYNSLRKNIAAAKRSGLPYIVARQYISHARVRLTND